MRDPQDPFNRPLRQSLASPGAEPAQARPDCLDAETIAAWMDDGLTGAQRAAAEAHASTCLRCQTLLAAFARTDSAVATAADAPAHAPLPFPAARRVRPLYWLLPLAAAAVVVIAIMPKRQSSVAPGAPATSASSTAAKESEPKQVARFEPSPSPATPADAPPAARDQDRALTSAEKLDRKDAAKKETAPAAASELAKTKTLADQTPRQAATAEPQRSTTLDAVQISNAAAARPAAPPPAVGFMQERVASTLTFATPDDAVRWRVTGSRVEQSTDKGETWHDVPTGVIARQVAQGRGGGGGGGRGGQQQQTRETFTAGSAPSPLVCWLAGTNGTVFVTIDGRTWRRLDFPDKTDLSSIVATDGLAATVRTVDGREFRTTDGGKSWIQASGLRPQKL